MIDPVVPADEGLTPSWFGAVLAGSPAVRAVRLEPMSTAGAGFFGRFARANLDYDPPGAGPATVVLKLAPADARVRAVGFDLGFFAREVGFYRHVAGAAPVRTPFCHLARLERATHRYVLVQEDLAAGRFGNQARGCSEDEVSALVGELAALHGWGASWAGRASLDGIGSFVATFADGFDRALASFTDRYGDQVPATGLETASRLGGRIDDVYASMARLPATVIHGDLRLDNVVFDLAGSERPVLYDWQSNASGPAGVDLASLLALWAEPEVARARRDDLLGQYRRARAAGGAAPTIDEVRDGFELGVVHWFFRAVQSAMGDSSLEMVDSLAVRATWALADVDADRLLGLLSR